jgi:hypothetical protein
LGLLVIERSRARQKPRLNWIRKGDVNTKFFHLMANTRKRKNFIHSLQTTNGSVISQQDKQDVVYRHFLQHTGTYVPRQCLLNFDALGWEPQQLSHLDQPFTGVEIKTVIMEAPKDKAPSSDGFIGSFFS